MKERRDSAKRKGDKRQEGWKKWMFLEYERRKGESKACVRMCRSSFLSVFSLFLSLASLCLVCVSLLVRTFLLSAVSLSSFARFLFFRENALSPGCLHHKGDVEETAAQKNRASFCFLSFSRVSEMLRREKEIKKEREREKQPSREMNDEKEKKERTGVFSSAKEQRERDLLSLPISISL